MHRNLPRASAICGAVVVLAACTDATSGPDRDGARLATRCAECHPSHAREWGLSPHAYAMRDPVFHAMVRVGQKETQGKLGDFCVSCHTPTGVADGETVVVRDAAGGYTQPTQGLGAEAMEGVSCSVCHSITKVAQTANAGFVLDRAGPRRATISDPVPSSAHASAFSAVHQDSKLCGSCHQVVNTVQEPSIRIEATFQEWVNSTFNPGQSCQDCHMPAYPGQAARGGPPREVHRHFFVGADVSLLGAEEFPGYDELRELTARLLREDSATLGVSFDAPSRRLALRIENKAGHALPSGATAARQVWVELVVRDGQGKSVFESGTFDERGDLRVSDPAHTTQPGTDPQLVLYTQQMLYDPSLADPSQPSSPAPVDFLWQPNAIRDTLILPNGIARPSYDLSALPAGSYTASVRLLFRSFAPHLLRQLETLADLDPAVKERLPVHEMQSQSLDLALP